MHIIPESVVLLSRTQNMLCFRPNNFHQCHPQFQLGCRVRFSMVLQLFGMMESMIAVLPLGLLKMQPLQWWSFCKVVFEDASLRGWGALFGGVVVRGVWTLAQSQLHTNHFEMLAAFLAMKHFSQRVLIRMDNTTVVLYINKQEVHYPLMKLSCSLLPWGRVHSLSLGAIYVPGHLNECNRDHNQDN